MNNYILEYNEFKRNELIKKIKETNGDYTIFLIDVDDVIYNTEPFMQKVLNKIDFRSTNKYRTKISKDNSEDSKEETDLSFKILNAILEEFSIELYNERLNRIERKIYEKIDYNKIYKDKNLFKYAIQFMNLMINQRNELYDNVFFVACSHRNPVREGIIKTQKLYEKIPGLDLVITIPFHVEPGSNEMNMKSNYVKNLLELDDLNHVILIDNTKKNCIDMRRNGGMDIRFLPQGFSKKHKLSDHLSKISDLDPTMIQFVVSYINYAREHPEYIDEVDITLEESLNKIKKLK